MNISSIRFSIVKILILLFLGGTFSFLNAQDKLQEEVNSYLKDLPFKSFSIQLPHFQNKSFNIKEYGAVGDGHTMNTVAFQKTINACSKAGGGKVIVPPGLWLTGPIELKSNVNFHVERGALILFSPDHKDYPIIKTPSGGFVLASPIYGFDLENIAITGSGLIDGNGTTWRPLKKDKVNESLWKKFVNSGGVVNDAGNIWYPSEVAMNADKYFVQFRKEKKKITIEDLLPLRDAMRPKMVSLMHCKKVLIDGVTLENSPSFAFNPNFCEDMVIRNVKVNNEYWAQNGDAMDIGSSKNVLLYKCTITAGDDGICMKANVVKGAAEAVLQNVVIADCVVYHAHGGFVTGSNTNGGMHNIYVHNCDFVGTDVGLRFKSSRGRGGLVDNIFIKNIFMKDIVNQTILFNTYYEIKNAEVKAFPVTDRTPIFKNIFIDSIFCDGAREAASVVGLPEMPIQNIQITNSYIRADRGFETDYAKGMTLDNVEIVPKEGPIFNVNQSADFVLNKIKYAEGAPYFMKVSGQETKSIVIKNTDLSNLKTPVNYFGEVDKGSVIIK